MDSTLEQSPAFSHSGRRAAVRWLRELALLPAIGVLVVVGIASSPAFFTTSNLSNTAQGSAALGMVVVAETIILLTGSFDLSLQSIYGLAPMVGAWLIVPVSGHGLGTDWSPAVGILVTLAIGAGVGLFNGFMIVKLRFNAFIFTLAMLILLAGIQQGIVSGQSVYNMPASFTYLGSAYWLGFPVSAWVTIGGLSRRRALPSLPPDGKGRLRDRRQPGGSRALPGSRSTESGSASSASPARWRRSAG